MHKVQILELKGEWSPSNRNVAFSLYDGYSKAQTLKKNLSSDALKGFKVDSSQTPTVGVLGAYPLGVTGGHRIICF